MKGCFNRFLAVFTALLLAYLALCVFYPATASAYTATIDTVYASLVRSSAIQTPIAQTSQALTHPVQAAHPSGPYSVIGKPTISAQFIDRVLCGARSPACGKGQALYNYGVQYGIDPAYALAFFKHESTYGKYGVARTNKGIGNIRCTPGYACLYGYRAYASWEAGYEDWYALIAWYINSLHKSTVDQIIPTYAPETDNNDVPGYTRDVEQTVSAWREQNKVARS